MGTRRQLLSVTNLTILFVMGLSQAYAQSSGGATKLYELRIYTANAGKFADFQRVFRSQALPLFTKYGIKNVFDGTVLEGARADGSDAANMLVCILAHQSRAAADRSWAAFEADVAWQQGFWRTKIGKRRGRHGPVLLPTSARSCRSSTRAFRPLLPGLASRMKPIPHSCRLLATKISGASHEAYLAGRIGHLSLEAYPTCYQRPVTSGLLPAACYGLN